MSDKATIASLQRTVAQQEAEVLRLRAEADGLADVALERAGEVERLRALLASPDCGEACPVQRRYVEAAVRATIEACSSAASTRDSEAAMKVEDVDPAPIVARVLGGGE